MKFQGDITSIPITDVAQNLSSNRKAGTLTIRHGGQIRHIAFQDGKIASYADNLGFSIPRWFSAKGLVDPQVLEKAVLKARKSRKKHLGALLEEASLLPPGVYAEHLRGILEESLYETFTLRDGTFEFLENEFPQEALDPEVTGAGLELAVGPILLESARRFDDWEALRKSLPPDGDYWRVPPAEKERRLQELKEDPLARVAVDLLDGSRPIGDVIARIPACRFDASKTVADLIGRKCARPLEASEILQHLVLRSGKDKEKALAQLRAAQEREPGNRDLLRKIADLSQEMGRKDECATSLKLLAHALQEDGDRQGAEEALHRSLRLNPSDLGSWQKLYDLTAAKGDPRSLYAFGIGMARHLRKLGLEEMARDHLARMAGTFPDRPELLLEHAASLFALGERAKAMEELLDLARELLKKDKTGEAEHVLAKALEFDHEHPRARELLAKIRSGQLVRRKAQRKRLLRSSIACLAVACLGLFFGYDLYARREFVLATRQVFAEGLIERGEYGTAADRLDGVRRGHAISLLRFIEGREILQALRAAQERKAAAAAAAPGAPQSPSAGPLSPRAPDAKAPKDPEPEPPPDPDTLRKRGK